MNDATGKPSFYSGSVYRLLSGAFGLFLAGVGTWILLSGQGSTIARIGGGAVMLLLGVNMVWSACRSKESWVSRIGPIP